jgi:hypothetical protein
LYSVAMSLTALDTTFTGYETTSGRILSQPVVARLRISSYIYLQQ